MTTDTENPISKTIREATAVHKMAAVIDAVRDCAYEWSQGSESELDRVQKKVLAKKADLLYAAVDLLAAASAPHANRRKRQVDAVVKAALGFIDSNRNLLLGKKQVDALVFAVTDYRLDFDPAAGEPPFEAKIERAAQEIYRHENPGTMTEWAQRSVSVKSGFRKLARAALEAAGVVD